jgi:hypothetical protein
LNNPRAFNTSLPSLPFWTDEKLSKTSIPDPGAKRNDSHHKLRTEWATPGFLKFGPELKVSREGPKENQAKRNLADFLINGTI